MEQKDISNFNESTGKKKIAAGIVTGVIIGLIIVATGFYLWTKVAPEISTSKSQQSGQKGNQFGPEGNQIPPANPQNQIPGQAGETNEANEIIGDAGENVSVCEDGWQALTNNDVGYRLCLPQSWAYKITDEMSEVTQAKVKYVTITSPDKKYKLHFGLKKKTDNFYTSDRTGVGAGDVKKIGKITVLGEEIDVLALSFENKVHEVFFGNIGSDSIGDDKYEMGAWFDASWDTYSGAGIDVNIPEVAAAKKIISSLSILEPDMAICHPLTNEDLLTMKGWKNITNNKYKYTFSYPDDWKVVSNEDDMISMEDKDKMLSFQFRSGTATEIGFAGNQKLSEVNVKIDCLDAHIVYFKLPNEGDQFDHYMTVATFKRGDTPHVILFSHKSLGASLDSDFGEQFNILLKTVNFN